MGRIGGVRAGKNAESEPGGALLMASSAFLHGVPGRLAARSRPGSTYRPDIGAFEAARRAFAGTPRTPPPIGTAGRLQVSYTVMDRMHSFRMITLQQLSSPPAKRVDRVRTGRKWHCP